MTQDSYSKRLIRERMRVSGEPYSVARRAELGLDDEITEQALHRLFDDIHGYLAGKGRWLVPHGFEETISGRTITVTMPVIWEPERGVVIARASEEPSTDNLDELRALVERGLVSGRYGPARSLVAWSTEMSDGPRPGNLEWTVSARV
jgi:hypothetical protein